DLGVDVLQDRVQQVAHHLLLFAQGFALFFEVAADRVPTPLKLLHLVADALALVLALPLRQLLGPCGALLGKLSINRSDAERGVLLVLEEYPFALLHERLNSLVVLLLGLGSLVGLLLGLQSVQLPLKLRDAGLVPLVNGLQFPLDLPQPLRVVARNLVSQTLGLRRGVTQNIQVPA